MKIIRFLKYLSRLFKHILCLLKESDKGYVILPYGNHVIKINSCCPASRVFLYIIDPEDGCHICGNESNVNTAGCEIVEDGFIVFANIKSNYATIEWLIKFEDE